MMSIAESYDPEYPTRVGFSIGKDIYELIEFDMLKAFEHQNGKLKLLILLQGRLARIEPSKRTKICLIMLTIFLAMVYAIKYLPRLIDRLLSLFWLPNNLPPEQNEEDFVEGLIEFD